MKKMSFSKKQQGLNLIELLLVLAIVIAVALAAFIIYPRVQAGRQATSNSQILSGALAQVQSIYQNGQYATLTSIVAAKSNVFPDSFVVDADAGTLVNEFAPDATANVTVFGSLADTTPIASNAARFVTITYGDVPSAVCIKLVPGLAANFGRIAVGATVVLDKFAAAPTDFDEAAMVTACTTADTADLTLTAR